MKLVIDTDAGVDDAIAMMMTLHGFPVDAVVGVTTVFGNVDLHQANHNVAHILQAVERSNTPVYSGASKAIVASVSEERWEGHGPDGLGGESGLIDVAANAYRKNEAVHALIDLSHRYPGELVVIALGPLTNVALAILVDPNFVANVKQFVVMGGTSRGEGNLTAHSEFNVGCDPEATNIVYQHCTADKLIVVPFETSLDHKLPWSVFDEIFETSESAAGAYIRRIWKFTKAYTNDSGFIPCDAYAVALLLHPKYLKKAKTLKGHIHLAPDERRGASVWTDADNDSANVTLVTDVDTDIFVELMRRLAT
ncbi:hypothetical protein Poli38472_004568 [Pythium oligandrum]|uniref:Inosine/uridine-preferring nucleoside hydrolase domain-containing protein n=1 Tax=Pythium oligandrum TaxID=41045 RepID=A0A8K1CA24_PYTOL|nr:hypothetical protein Poli38472_004568 [Pythium oligandrum]|eukprot:TMW59499.1 hypothetical protein Poli38472_004568 [Pythium oligandrum]